MTSIKRTGQPPKTTQTQRATVSSCGPTPRSVADSACGGGWVGKASRKSEKAKVEQKPAKHDAHPRKETGRLSSACGGAGWSRWGKIPSGC